jgi:predicted deacylase
MLAKQQQQLFEPLIARSSQWVRAPQSGILRTIISLGKQVDIGDIVGWIADPFGNSETEVQATASGIIIGKTNLPLVHEGEALFHIACFAQAGVVAESVEAFQDEHRPLGDKYPSEESSIK